MAANKYAGDCLYCGETVEAGAGVRIKHGSSWFVAHPPDLCAKQSKEKQEKEANADSDRTAQTNLRAYDDPEWEDRMARYGMEMEQSKQDRPDLWEEARIRLGLQADTFTPLRVVLPQAIAGLIIPSVSRRGQKRLL